jgi:hypothetical protein
MPEEFSEEKQRAEELESRCASFLRSFDNILALRIPPLPLPPSTTTTITVSEKKQRRNNVRTWSRKTRNGTVITQLPPTEIISSRIEGATYWLVTPVASC